MIQSILVGIILFISVVYITRRLWKQLFTKSENCEGCAVGKASNTSTSTKL